MIGRTASPLCMAGGVRGLHGTAPERLADREAADQQFGELPPDVRRR